MIAVDTNVVSELMKTEPDARVVNWASTLDDEEIAVPALVLAELLRGLHRLPVGARRARLEAALAALLSHVGEERVLPFDARSAVAYAQASASRERSGRPLDPVDGLIAATCWAHGASLATRNIDDFAGVGVELIDPWAPGR